MKIDKATFNKLAREYNAMRLRVQIIADKQSPRYIAQVTRLQEKYNKLQELKAQLS